RPQRRWRASARQCDVHRVSVRGGPAGRHRRRRRCYPMRAFPGPSPSATHARYDMTFASLRLRGVARYAVAAALALASCRSTSPSSAGSPAPQPVTRLGQFKAVLINGGGRPPVNFPSHPTHVRTLVEFLRAHDVSEHDIVIFSSDGTDPAADLTTRAVDTEPDTWLLPPGLAHRLRPVQLIDSVLPGYTLHPATRDAPRNWFETDGRQLGSGDTLLLYVTDHGEQNKKE